MAIWDELLSPEDVLAALRGAGAPHRLTPTHLAGITERWRRPQDDTAHLDSRAPAIAPATTHAPTSASQPEVWPMASRPSRPRRNPRLPGAWSAASTSWSAAMPSPSAAHARWARLMEGVRPRARARSQAASRAATSGQPSAWRAIRVPPRRSSPEGVRPGPNPIRDSRAEGGALMALPEPARAELSHSANDLTTGSAVRVSGVRAVASVEREARTGMSGARPSLDRRAATSVAMARTAVPRIAAVVATRMPRRARSQDADRPGASRRHTPPGPLDAGNRPPSSFRQGGHSGR